ncbi:MAG: DUF4190 domain-containing protein [bacterium]
MAIKTCPSCGGENHENATVCLRCNADLSSVPPSGVPTAPPTPPPPMFPQSPQMVAEPQTNGMATASLVLGIASLIFSFLTGIVGLILGIIAAVQINSSGGRQKGMGMAISGICLSVFLPLVLPAVLFPVFSKGHVRSTTQQCQNNQRQIAIAISMYTQEHDEVLPDATTVWTTIKLTSSQRSNTALLQGYSSVLRCPDSKRANGYGFNKEASKLALGDTRITDPTIILLTADGGDSQNLLTQIGDIDINRHKKMFVSSFLDGHIELIQASKVSPQVLNIR